MLLTWEIFLFLDVLKNNNMLCLLSEREFWCFSILMSLVGKLFYQGHLEQVLLYFFQNVILEIVNQYDMFISFCSLGLWTWHNFDMLIVFWSLKSSGMWYVAIGWSVADVLKCHSALIFRIEKSEEHHIPEDVNLQRHKYVNFESCMIILLL